MDKEEAIEILNNYSFWKWDNFGNSAFTFPLHDDIVYMEVTEDEVVQYTFKHIIKFLYDLQDKPKQD
jgi:hypothetical protein